LRGNDKKNVRIAAQRYFLMIFLGDNMDYLKGKPIGLMLITGLVMALAVPALASDYPAKPITLVIPYPAGGSTDVTGRVLATAAKRYFGQPVIVENKGGEEER
jgi:hypothetical protein